MLRECERSCRWGRMPAPGGYTLGQGQKELPKGIRQISDNVEGLGGGVMRASHFRLL